MFLKLDLDDPLQKLCGLVFAVINKYFPNIKQDRELFEECLSEGLLKVIELYRNDKYDDTLGKPSTFYYTCIRRQILTFLKQRNKKKEKESVLYFDPIKQESNLDYTQEYADIIETSILEFKIHLTKRYKEIMELRGGGLTGKQIAKCLGISVSRTFQILNKLRERWHTFCKQRGFPIPHEFVEK